MFLSAVVNMDKLRLSQVIGNILFNSYKYADTPIDISFRLDESFLEVSISDSGSGVRKIGIIYNTTFLIMFLIVLYMIPFLISLSESC